MLESKYTHIRKKAWDLAGGCWGDLADALLLSLLISSKSSNSS